MNDGSAKTFPGIYEGTVVQNIDPENRGRLICTVPDVLGLVPTTWVECCTPLAGPTGPPMGIYFVPPIGAGVWVTFVHGNANKPVWLGCRFGSVADVPPLAQAGLPISPNIIIQTAGQNTVMISDVPGPTGGIMLKSPMGASIIVNDSGIYIQNGKGATITLVGPAISVVGTPVDMNSAALTVT